MTHARAQSPHTAYETAVLQSLDSAAQRDVFPGLHYRNHYDFVLQHGQFFESPPHPRPAWYRRMKARCCFGNSAQLAMRRGLHYVEGFATTQLSAGLLIHHGWCVDDQNRVIDATWREPGLAYFGVPFDWMLMFTTSASNEFRNLLDDWERGWPILTKPLNRRRWPRSRMANC